MNRERLISEAARLKLSVRDVKQLYREAPQFVSPPPFPPSDFVHNGNKNALVIGQDRAKYFDVPRIAQRSEVFVEAKEMRLHYPPEGHQIEKKLKKAIKKTHKKQIKQKLPSEGDFDHLDMMKSNTNTISVQTDYRENDAQTDPYTPQYKVFKGENPEVLNLQHLTYKRGLKPINKETMKEIDKLRRRRKVESSLPMGRDKKSFEKRCQLLKKLEMKEWMEREEKIKKEQEKKFRQLKKQIERGQMEIEERNQLIIDDISKNVYLDLTSKLDKIELMRGKLLNRTMKKFTNPEGKKIKKKVLSDDLFNFDEPEKFEGRAHTKLLDFEIKPNLLSDPDMIERIERKYLPKFNTKLKGKVERGTKKKLKVTQRVEQKIKNDIEFSRKIKELKMEKKKQNMNLLDLYRKTPRIFRPRTPVLEYDDDDDELQNAVITIQKLLRGRATQNTYCVAKERTLELIKELQRVEKVIERERRLEREENYIEEIEKKKRKKELNYLVDNIHGEMVSKSLDYLAKELVRQKENEKIEILRTKGEMDRSQREKEEMNRRKNEKTLREKEQNLYNETMKSHNSTIDSYIDQIFEKVVDKYSYNEALKTVKNILDKRLEKINGMRENEKKELNSDNTPSTDELEIRDLVSSFLVPQVKRELLKKKVENEQQKYMESAESLVPSELMKFLDDFKEKSKKQ